MRYYPVDQHGGIDEWGAVIQHHAEVHQRESAEQQMKMRKDQISYHKDLDAAVDQKA